MSVKKYASLAEGRRVRNLLRPELRREAYKRCRLDVVRRIYNDAKKRAKRDGLVFAINKEHIKVPTHCPIMGTEITNIQGQGRVPTNASIDRVDPTKGYLPDNIMIISYLANRMKTDTKKEDLVKFAHGIIKLYGELNE